MKRISTFLCVVILLLAGCTETKDSVPKVPEEKLPVVAEEEVEKEEKKEVEEVIKKLTPDLAEFHFVADWLTNTEILFVEKDESAYLLKSFNITTGEIKILYENPTIIVDVLVHPVTDKLLIHMTDNPESATVKVISFDGIIEHEVTIESSELEIEWNDIEPSLILFTAFYEDWTFDVFLFDGTENDLHLFSLDNPFPRWLGTEKIVASNLVSHSSDGEELDLYDRVSGERQLTNQSGVIYFDTYQKSLLLVQINEEDEAVYSILTQDLSTLSTWTMPVEKNDAGWEIPEIDWLASEQLHLAKNRHQDELNEAYELVLVTSGEQEVVVDEVPAGPLRCSPDGEKCLIGYSFEKLINLKNQQEVDWLVLSN